jgi:hypothetical protein
MKFQLALRMSTDPVTAAGVALVSAGRQAANSPRYGQGWGAYGERFGATAADGFSDIMIGGAILPSLLHQDPRYFYQGTGTAGSRIRHALFSPFVAKGDNGKWMPNYSSIGGDLASSALSNVYYPRSNRGIGLVFGNFALGTAERVGASLAQEFILGKFTRRNGHMEVRAPYRLILRVKISSAAEVSFERSLQPFELLSESHRGLRNRLCRLKRPLPQPPPSRSRSASSNCCANSRRPSDSATELKRSVDLRNKRGCIRSTLIVSAILV